MASQQISKTKQGRVSRPKVKTGCITCKYVNRRQALPKLVTRPFPYSILLNWMQIRKTDCAGRIFRARRVKCDEAMPACLQCLRTRRECHGYQHNRIPCKQIPAALPLPLLLPKTNIASQLSYPPSTFLFNNDQEAFCFDYFCKRMASNLSGPFDSALWSQLIPQACQTHPPIRHVVFAVSALNFMSESDQSLSKSPEQRAAVEKTEKYRQFALQHYSKALHQMRSAASENKENIRILLMACILVVCFETLYGKHESALAQVQTGIGLLNNCFDTNSSPVTKTMNISSPCTCVIEEELVQSFARLDIHVLTYMKSRPTDSHLTMTSIALTTLGPMPQYFSTVNEARIYLEASQQLLLHPSISKPTQDFQVRQDLTDVSRDIVAQAFTEKGRVLEELGRWHVAFSPIFQRVRASKSEKDFLGAMTLQLHYLTTYFTVSSAAITTPGPSHDFMPLFEEMISLSQSILEHPDSGNTSYTFDGQVIKPLWTVARKCLHRVLRRQAISLLLGSSRREGFWDNKLCGKLALWLTEIEEEDIVGDYVPEGTTINNLMVKVDFPKQTAHVGCSKPENSVSGKPRLRNAVLTW